MSTEKAEVARQIGARLEELVNLARQAGLPMVEYLLATALAEADAVENAERPDRRS